jgi:3-keto-L-gulonate-6-phosphate decarboxylase
MKAIAHLALAAGLVLFTGPVFADHHEGKNFEEHKANMVKELDERLASLNAHKTCVSAAKDHEAMKACHEKMKEVRQENRMEHMEKRKERMEKRMERMKEKAESKK